MSGPERDLEQLAALVDGRLDERERQEVLARAAESDDEFELLLDTLEIAQALELEGAPGGEVVPLAARQAGAWRTRALRWGALAAVVTGVSLVGALVARGRGSEAQSPARYAALLESETLPVEATARPWMRVRERSQPLSPRARAARLGAALLDLEVAVGARDPRAEAVVGEILSLLKELPASGTLAERYREVASRAGAPPADLEPLLEGGRKSVAKRVDEDFFQLGAWTEAGRIAAHRRNATFFRSVETRAALSRLAKVAPPSANPDEVANWVHAAAGGTVNWNDLHRVLTGLLQALGDAAPTVPPTGLSPSEGPARGAPERMPDVAI